jgi:hypothetical protein
MQHAAATNKCYPLDATEDMVSKQQNTNDKEYQLIGKSLQHISSATNFCTEMMSDSDDKHVS